MLTNYPNLKSAQPASCHGRRIVLCERLILNVYRKYFKPFCLTTNQVNVLFVLAKAGPKTQTELSKLLVLEKSSISRNIQVLLTTGLIKKVDNKKLTISTQGLNKMEQVVPAWEDARKEVNDVLGDAGNKELDQILRKLQHLNNTL
ncbi:MAG: DNA-binding MarR family transcriptional regulator [Bacteroidia bacterium]